MKPERASVSLQGCLPSTTPYNGLMPANLLTTISWAAESLSREPRQLFHVVRVLLADLQRMTGMDAAELYLADPRQSCLLMSGYCGEDREAFFDRKVFRFGEGFPGLAAQTRQAVATTHLESDERYLRQRVKALGYHAFLSYPLLLPHAVVGVVNLAAKDLTRMEEAQRSLALISPLLAASLYAVMTSLSERTLRHVQAARTTRERILALLEDSLETTDALRATLHLSGGGTVETHPGQLPPCAGWTTCPARNGQICVSGLSELGCPSLTPQHQMVCLPLWDGDEVRAVTMVQFAQGSGLQSAAAPLMWIGRLATGALGLQSSAPSEDSAPWLEIETFGAFRVRRNGEVLSHQHFKRRQAYQLLKVLVTRFGRPTHADELCEALWPGELVDDKVLARLHVTVNALRNVVEPPGSAQPVVILREGASYRFAPATQYRLDAEVFERLIQQADLQSGPTALSTYAQALHLYRGDFMADDPYAESFALERDYLREMAIRSLFRSAEVQEGAGLIQDALTSYSRILTIDPLHFEAHETLISFLVHHNRLDDAQNRWEHYAAAYGAPPPIPAPLGGRGPRALDKRTP